MNGKKVLRIALFAVFIGYAAVLVRIVLLRQTGVRSLQTLPFAFIGDIVSGSATPDVLLKNIAGNFALFLPLGILLPAAFPRLSFGKTALVAVGVSFAIECVQYAASLGISDVDDLILNGLGGCAGAGIYFGVFYRNGREIRAQAVSLAFLALFGCVGAVCVWLYAPGLVPTPVTYVSAEVLGEYDTDGCDLEGYLTGLDGSAILLRSGSCETAAGAPVPKNRYELAADAGYFRAFYTYRYSPNGNVQAITVTYSALTREELAAIAAEGGFCDMWLDGDGLISAILVTVYETPR